MPYGNLLADVVQGSVANTPPAFRDGNGTQVGTLCRAWVNFNGTGTVAIRASFNVSSITDNGVGNYTINFINAMPDANYACVWTVATMATTEGFAVIPKITTNLTTSTTIGTGIPSNTTNPADSSQITVSIFR